MTRSAWSGYFRFGLGFEVHAYSSDGGLFPTLSVSTALQKRTDTLLIMPDIYSANDSTVLVLATVWLFLLDSAGIAAYIRDRHKHPERG